MRFFACLSRTKRSSSAAAISLPSMYRAAEGSWLRAPDRPRIVNAKGLASSFGRNAPPARGRTATKERDYNAKRCVRMPLRGLRLRLRACTNAGAASRPKEVYRLLRDQPVHPPATRRLRQLLGQPRQQLAQFLFQPPRRVGDGQARAIEPLRAVLVVHVQLCAQQLGRTSAGQVLVEAGQ